MSDATDSMPPRVSRVVCDAAIASRPDPVDLTDDRRCREIFESALVGVYASTPEGTLVWCNPAFARILGFTSVEEAMSTNMATVYPSPAQRAAWVERVRAGERFNQIRLRLRRRDQAFVHVMTAVTGVFDPQGNLIELRGFIMDVTATTAEEHALKKREQQFRALFLDAVDPMLVMDDERAIVDANRAASSLLGEAIEGLVGRTFDEFLVDDADQLPAAWREVLALGEARRDHRVQSKARGVRVVECSYRAAIQAGRHLCIARDITARLQLEERLLQSEKVESVGRLAGGIAHDFNNLLTAILGYTELLLANRAPEDPDRADLAEIQKAGQRAASLTQQLLAYSRKQMLMPKDVDLNQTVTNLQGMLGRLIREDISLTCEVAPEAAVVKIDPTQIEQVILNLVLNARDALPGGGVIRIEVATVRLEDVDVPSDHSGRAAGFVRLRVADNGVGISPEAWPHLFEPFFTTKEIGKGTGLGLASVYGIVRQSNGFLSVESEPGLGTVFTMHFPAVEAAAPHEDGAVAAKAADHRGQETILLVEDEDAVRTIIAAVLRKHGYQVLDASNAKGAIEIFERRGQDVDLLLTDVVMPEMNGPALAQRLVAERPELRVLFISGYADAALPLDASGPNVSFLGKPFQAGTLATKVREMLAPRRRRASRVRL